MPGHQLTLDLDAEKPLDEWDDADLMEWLSRFGTFELGRDERYSAGDIAYSLDVTPPIMVWLMERVDKWGHRFKDIHMTPQDDHDWNRGCPGCSGSFPDWVERHIRSHTGENFPNDRFIKETMRDDEE